MPPTTLNNDILLSIMSISPPETATSIMGTCRLLYHEGAKIVLQSPVNLDGSEQEALALLRFVQAENLSRCPYVRSLHILMDPVPRSVANILAKVVSRMSGLSQLALVGDQMFKSFPPLLPIFASLRAVKTLVVFDAGERCCELIRTLQSSLVSATVNFDRLQAATLSLTAAAHPVVLLARSAATLEALSCGFLSNTPPQLTLFPPKTAYPRLRRLTLTNSIYPDPLPFIRAAPHVAHVALENTLYFAAEDPLATLGGELHMNEMHRMMNLELQGAADPESESESLLAELGLGTAPCQWKDLRTFTGRVVDLWILGLACRIPKLLLTDAPPARPRAALTAALAHARPAFLQISFKGQPLGGVLGPGSDLLAALRSEGAAGVQCLVVQLDVMPQDEERGLDVGRVLDDLASAISGLGLCHLQLSVDDGGLSGAASSSSTGTGTGTEASAAHPEQHRDTSASPTTGSGACSAPLPLPVTTDRAALSVAERTLDELDVHEYAKRLMGSIGPSLNDAAVRINRPNRRGGSQRIAILGTDRHAMLCTGGEIVYRELTRAQLERFGPVSGPE